MMGRASVWRGVRRLCLCLGIAALSYAGGMLAYADVSQRYQSWKFDRETAMDIRPIAAVMPDEPTGLQDGDLIGRLEIPRIHLSVMIFHGVGDDVLARGAGHVPGTPLPGADGNAAIAGHRDTFFRALRGIRAGDVIRVTTVRRRDEYIVDATETVAPDETRVIESRGRQELTLITCYPFSFIGAAPSRFIVHARPRE